MLMVRNYIKRNEDKNEGKVMKQNKYSKRTRLMIGVKTAVSLLIMFGIILGSPIFPAPVMAAEETGNGQKPAQLPNINITWEEEPGGLSAASISPASSVVDSYGPITVRWDAQSINRTFTAQDRADLFETVGPYSYAVTNTFGTWREDTGITGITVKEFLEKAGINTSDLEANREIIFVGSDTVRTTFTWGNISEPRYHYAYPTAPSGSLALFMAGTRGEQVQSIISFNTPENPPRNYLGMTYPEEQVRGLMNRVIVEIQVGGLAAVWSAPYITLENVYTALPGSYLVNPGDKLRVTSSLGDASTSFKYFYTTDGTEPVPGKAGTFMFNFNSNAPSITVNPSIVVPADNGSGVFVIKAMTYGFGRTQSETVTFTYMYEEAHNAGKLDQLAPAGLSGGILFINGTTSAMEYNTSPAGATGWTPCTGGGTLAAPGVYYVRFASTATHKASPTVSIVVSDKNSQSPPSSLIAGIGIISGTLTSMEYHTDPTSQTGWTSCGSGSTIVSEGTYYVRFAETATYKASSSVQVVVSSKLSQQAPTGLAGSVTAITGTTMAMEYHSNQYALTGWTTCANGSTAISVEGTYYVRFAETATQRASDSVLVFVGKLSREAPTGLTAGSGVINGTTAAMEYHTNFAAETGWTACTAPNTSVKPGTYFVRLAENATHKASPGTMIVVTDDVRGPTVISVYIGGRLAKEFTKSDIDALQKHGPNTYSNYNTWPTYGTNDGVIGARVLDLLAASGIANLSSSQGIKFTSSDGVSSVITVGQLEEPRYFFSSGGAVGGRLPSVINFVEGGEYRRLFFGQAAASEQTRQDFIKDVIRIDVEGGAGNWGSPGVNPAEGTVVKKGDLIRLTMPPGQGDAKIYYTLDGSAPTRSSNMYNPVADRWLTQKGMTENAPIIAPSGTFTIRARIIGVGKSDGPVVSFSFTDAASNPNDQTGPVMVTPEDLIENGVIVAPGDSFFVPAAFGSIKWNEDEFDGYYDEELGGYVFTPKPGFTGVFEFTYVDEDGVEHIVSVTVGESDDGLKVLEDGQTPQAAGSGSGSGSGPSGKGKSGMPQWALITLGVAGAAAGGVFGVTMPDLIRKLKKRGSEV